MLTGCQATGPNSAIGGAFGTLVGGLSGAAIGAHDGKATEGALIGAVTGGSLGTIAGNAVDQEIQLDRARATQQSNQAIQNAIQLPQVIELSRSGLSESVIVQQIRNQGVAQRPTANELILLQNEGVSDAIIQAYQTAPIANSQPVVVASPTPVFYEEYPVRPYVYRDWCPPKRRRPRAGVSIRF